MRRFHGRLAVQQRVLPNYRAPFFDLLASACDGGMSLFTGLPRKREEITTAKKLQVANYRLGKNVHVLNGPLYLCYQRGLLDWLKKWNPEALIVEANPRYIATPSAVKWMHQQNRPVIGWGLGSPPGREFLKRRMSSFLSQFDALIAYSQRGAYEYAGRGFPAEKIFVAHNSVSAPQSFPLPSKPLTFNLKPNILFVGRLQARKRVEDLLLACAQVEPNPRLVVVGDGPERERYESLAREIYPGTEFVGARHGAELAPFFREADLFVLPGTGGLAIQEAMSYGLPVIVAEGDGTQADLVRKENGWQIPPGSVHDLIQTMKDALSDVTRLRRMGEESYRIVKEEINIEKMVGTFVQALNLLTGK
jgi:glycosyltransferase involved in cell wall biosynthesis